jgi:hypothetical protein
MRQGENISNYKKNENKQIEIEEQLFKNGNREQHSVIAKTDILFI